jgi:hypothetical protein
MRVPATGTVVQTEVRFPVPQRGLARACAADGHKRHTSDTRLSPGFAGVPLRAGCAAAGGRHSARLRAAVVEANGAGEPPVLCVGVFAVQRTDRPAVGRPLPARRIAAQPQAGSSCRAQMAPLIGRRACPVPAAPGATSAAAGRPIRSGARAGCGGGECGW